MNRRPIGAFLVLAIALAVPLAITAVDVLQTDARAPDFTVTDTGWEDGIERGAKTFTLSDHRGDTVLIDFMAYHCGTCRFVTPQIMEPTFERFHNESGFHAITIDVGNFARFPGSTHDNLVKWQTEEFDSPWPHALDSDGVFLRYLDLCVGGVPCLLVVDGQGDVVFTNTGVAETKELHAAIEASLQDEASTVSVLQVGVIGLAFIAGVLSFFAPCSVGLIPAYMGFLLNRQAQEGNRSVMVPGFQTAAGIVSLYAVLAVVLWIFQDALSPILPVLSPIVGTTLIVFGILMLINFDWEGVAKRLGMGKIDGRKGFFVFGVGYALAAFGCTGPIFLPILVAGFAQGVGIGLLAFAVYAAAIASFVVLAAYLVGAGKQTRLKALLEHTTTINRVSAGLLILAGLWLVIFDLRAFQVL